MKKEQMFQELLEVYTRNPDLFEENKIKYLKWIDSLKTHEHTRRAYSFMFKKLYLCFIPLEKIWKCHTKETWTCLRIQNMMCDEVVKLRAELRDFNTVWRVRPRKRK